jgi:hypothetical protein
MAAMDETKTEGVGAAGPSSRFGPELHEELRPWYARERC